jgi:PAS domain S-box-containing protein
MRSKLGLYFKNITENSADDVLPISGDDGKTIYYNPQTGVIFGCSGTELLNHRFMEFLHPWEQKKQFLTGQQRLDDEPATDENETWVVIKDSRPPRLTAAGTRIL